jgi:hypothetical protein
MGGVVAVGEAAAGATAARLGRATRTRGQSRGIIIDEILPLRWSSSLVRPWNGTWTRSPSIAATMGRRARRSAWGRTALITAAVGRRVGDPRALIDEDPRALIGGDMVSIEELVALMAGQV